MNSVEPPCTIVKEQAESDVSESSQNNNENTDPVLLEKAEADVEKKVHKEHARNIPDVRMPSVMRVDLKRVIDLKRNFSDVHHEDINEERKSCRDEYRDHPGRDETLEEIRLILRTLVKSESREKEKHSDHRISCRYEDIKTVPDEVRIDPGSTCHMRAVMEHDNDSTETQKALRVIKRHYIFIPRILFIADLDSKEE